MPIYHSGEKSYNIPPILIESFEKDNPNATVEISDGEGKYYNLPISEQVGFRKKFPKWTYEKPTEMYAPESEEKEPENDTANIFEGKISKELKKLPGIATTPKLNNPLGGIESPFKDPLKFSQNLVELHEKDKETVTGQLNQAYQRRDKLKKQIDENTSEVIKNRDNLSAKDRATAELSRANKTWLNYLMDLINNDASEYDTSGTSERLQTALHETEKEIIRLEKERDRGNGADIGFWRSFGDELKSPDFSLFGVGTGYKDFMSEMKPATTEDAIQAQNLLDEARYHNQQAQSQYSENDDIWAVGGSITAQALPFMTEIFGTGGTGTIIKGGTKWATKQLAKKGLEAGAKGLKQRAQKFTIKALGHSIDDVPTAFMRANTLGVPRTLNDINARHRGTVTFDNENGYKYVDGESLGTAIAKGQIANAISFWTESAGRYIELGGKALGKTLRPIGEKIGRNLGLSSISNAFSRASSSELGQLLTRATKAGGYNGYFGEVLEEELDLFTNALLVGDNKFSDLWDADTQIELWGGMIFMSGAMGCIRSGGAVTEYYTSKNQLNKSDKQARTAIGADEWNRIRTALDDATNEHLVRAIHDNIFENDKLNENQRKDALNYAESLIYFRGSNTALTVLDRDYYISPEQQVLNEQMNVGANLKNPQDAITQLLTARDEVAQLLGVENPEYVNTKLAMTLGTSDPVKMLQAIEELPNEQDQQIFGNYILQQALFNGMLMKRNEMQEQETDEATEFIKETSTKSGERIIVEFENGTRGYVVGEDISFTEDGAIDIANSGQTVIVQEDGTGERKQISINGLTLLSRKYAQDEINEATAQIQQRYSDEFRNWERAYYATKASDEQVKQPEIEQPEAVVEQPATEVRQPETPKTGEVQPSVPVNWDIVTPGNILFFGDENGTGAVAITEVSDGNYYIKPFDTKTRKIKEDVEAQLVSPEDMDKYFITAQGAIDHSNYLKQQKELETSPFLALIPKGTDGNPIYEQAKFETTLNTIIEQTENDLEMAKSVINDMIADKETSLKKLQNSKSKGGSNVAEKIASEKERKKAIEKANADLAYWTVVKNKLDARLASDEQVKQPEVEVADKKPTPKNIGAVYNTWDTPNSLREAILRDISSGKVKFIWANSKKSKTRGLGAHLGFTDDKGERARRIWLLDNNKGIYPETYAERVFSDLYDTGENTNLTSQDAFNELLDILLRHNSAWTMYEEAKRIHYNEADLDNIIENEEQKYLEYKFGEDLYSPINEGTIDITNEIEENDLTDQPADLPFQIEDKPITIENDAQQLATDAVIRVLTDSGIEVVNATDEMAEAVLGMADVELMAVEEAKRRADAIEELTPINITTNTKTKEELSEDYKKLSPVEKDGRVIEFYNSAFKKIYKDGGLFAQVVPQLDDILKQSVLAYSEADNLGGTMRPDGTVHKAHPNVLSFDNYVGKVEIEGKEYYVRTTVQEEKSGQTGTHAYMVTEVSLYENTTEGLSLPITTRARGTFDGVIDTKLQQFFDYANGKLNNPEFHIVYHGSGAKFDAFDHRHMGEGEGAQAYGWGTYVTEVKGISKWYANKGSRRGLHITYDGEPFGDILDNMFDGVWQLWKRYIFEATTTEDLKERINSLFIDDSLASPQSKWRKEVDRQKKELLAHIDNGRIKVGAVRQLYTVEIPDDTGSNYLNWDAQVKSEQAERINAGLQEIEETLNGYESGDARLMYKRSGEQIYNRLQMLLGSDKVASEFLARNGFVGIKYLAQSRSGGRADKASNYVIFNEADAKIVNRVEFLRTPQGTVYGWTDGNKIYLTKDGINPETPIHEYTHIWAKAMMQNNPDGWNSIKDLLRDTPIWNEVISDPNYADIRNDEDAVTSEVLSRMSGKENARRMEQEAQRLIDEAQGETAKADATNLIQRMRKALNEFWNWVAADLFHIKEFDSIEQITDRVLWDMLNGTELNATPDGRTEKQIIGEQGASEISIDDVNAQFNQQLDTFSIENADSTVFDLGQPSEVLLSAGVEDKPMKLYGSKVAKKMKKHGFSASELRNLPKTIAEPIAVFDNYGKEGNRSILTELKTEQGNFLVSLSVGKGLDIDFNIISSVFGKGDNKIVNWFNNGYATYIDKKKALNYLHLSAPIAEASNNQELDSATKIVNDFVNPNSTQNNSNEYQKENNTNLRSLNKNNDKNELSLQKINSNDVSKRISQEDNRSLSEEDGRMAEIANRLQERSRAYEESNGRSGQTISEYERKEIELKEAETYAKENGLWLDMSDAMRLGEPGPSGNENDTYVAYDNTIYKINNLINSKGIVQLLNKILLHNKYFPQTSYKLVGFTGFDGRNVYPILEQQYVKNATFATPEEIDSYMRGLGFEQVGEASYSNEKITISDLRPRNVMKDTDGDIYVIDAEFNVNQKETDLLREQGIEFLESNSNLQQLTPEDATNHTVALEQRAQEVANKLGVEVEIDNSLRAKGAYNTRTGRIRINPSRCVTEQDVEKTILHEALGHGGIQAVTGARFNDVCRMAYDLMSEEQRADFRRRHGNIDDEAIGAEFMAELAENGIVAKSDISKWERIKAYMRELLRKIGLTVQLTEQDIKYMLYTASSMSRKRKLQDAINLVSRVATMQRQAQQSSDPMQDATSTTLLRPAHLTDIELEDLATGKLGFTDVQVADVSYLEEISRNTRLAKSNEMSKGQKFSTAMVDRTLPIALFIKDVYGLNLDDAYVHDPENNAHILANCAGGSAMYRCDKFSRKMQMPLMETINILRQKYKDFFNCSYDYASAMIRLYATAKTAEERQRIKSASAPDTDFAGIAGILKEIGVIAIKRKGKADLQPIDWNAEAKKMGLKNHEKLSISLIETVLKSNGFPSLQEFIKSVESISGESIQDLWKQTKEISRFILKGQTEAGLLSATSYQRLAYGKTFTEIAMNKGLPQDTKYDSYTDIQQLIDDGVITEDEANSLTPYYSFYLPLKGTVGLKQSDILDYKNTTDNIRHKQAVQKVSGHSNMVRDPLTQLIYDAKVAIHNETENRWKIALFNTVKDHMANVPEGERIATITKYSETSRPKLPAFDDIETNKKLIEQHQVIVYVNGKAYIMTFANKAVAEACNSQYEPESKFWEYVNTANRYISNTLTSRNPAFIIPNVTRDVQAGYMYNYMSSWRQAGIFMKLMGNAKSRQNLYDLLIFRENKKKFGNTKYAEYVEEFLENGGQTAYNQVGSLDALADELKRVYKEMSGTDSKNIAKKTGREILAWIDRMSAMSELSVRLATFIAARECGKPIALATLESKEVSTNFDRKGQRKWVKKLPLFGLFLNASIQSLRREKLMMRKDPKRYWLYRIRKTVYNQLAIPALGYMSYCFFGDDDDQIPFEDYMLKYYSSNPTTATSNILIPWSPYGMQISIPTDHSDKLGNMIAHCIVKRAVLGGVKGEAYNAEEAFTDDLMLIASSALEMTGEHPVSKFVTGLSGDMTIDEASIYSLSANPVLAPIVETALNSDYKGDKFYGEPKNPDNIKPKHSYDYRKDTMGHAIAKALSDITGGTEYDAGIIDIYGASIDQIINTAFGGLGYLTGDVFTSGSNLVALATDKEIERYGRSKEVEFADIISDFPIVNRFAKTSPDQYNKVAIRKHNRKLAEKSSEWSKKVADAYKAKDYYRANKIYNDVAQSSDAQDFFLSLAREKVREIKSPSAEEYYNNLADQTYHSNELDEAAQANIIIGQAILWKKCLPHRADLATIKTDDAANLYYGIANKILPARKKIFEHSENPLKEIQEIDRKIIRMYNALIAPEAMPTPNQDLP